MNPLNRGSTVYEFENLTSHRGKVFLGLLGRVKIFEKEVNIHIDRIRIEFQIG